MRTRKVVSTKMVAHLWAHQTQDEARNKQGNFYFRDFTIYSYGSHFPIARIYQTKDSGTVVLFTNKKYSVTTANHKGIVQCSIPFGAHIVVVPHVFAVGHVDHKMNLRYLRNEFIRTQEELVRSRKHSDSCESRLNALMQQHAVYRAAFGVNLDTPLELTEGFEEEAKARVKAQQKAKREATKAAIKAAKEKEERSKQAMEEWKQGKLTTYPIHHLPVALRVKPTEPETVQTSKGAEVPLSHAARLWKMVKAIKAGHREPYIHNGHSTLHAGVFRVGQIRHDGTLITGCHVIEFDAMREFAERLGWALV